MIGKFIYKKIIDDQRPAKRRKKTPYGSSSVAWDDDFGD
jgi:hypothetical protein